MTSTTPISGYDCLISTRCKYDYVSMGCRAIPGNMGYSELDGGLSTYQSAVSRDREEERRPILV